MRVLILLAVAFCASETAEIPSFFKTCKTNIKNLNDCILDAGRSVLPKFSEGIPELGVEPLDPLFLGKVDIVTRGNGALSIILQDVNAHGLGKAHLYTMKVDLKRQKVGVKFATELTLKGRYKVNGHILILPIIGNGDFIIKIERSNCSYKYEYDIVKDEKGTTHIKISTDDLKCNLGKTVFNLENLFGGDQTLGGTLNRFLNENWESVLKEVSPPVIRAINIATKDVVNTLYSRVPMDVLLPPE